MLDERQRRALEGLEAARAAHEQARRASRWSDLMRLEAEAWSAWETVHGLFPTETVTRLGDVPECDVGAPRPTVIGDHGRVWLAYYTRGNADERAVVRFDVVDTVMFGGPNDEALPGHRLSGCGLVAYAFQEVINSAWITSRERENSVHPQHRGGWHAVLRHYVFTFHDETFECLARTHHAADPGSLTPAMLAMLQLGGGPISPN